MFEAQQAYTETVLRHALGENWADEPTPYGVASLGPVAPPTNAQGMRVWFSGFGGNDVLSGTDGQGSLHSQIAGGMLGLDKWIDAGRMIGVSIGGSTSNFSVADRASQGHTNAVNVSGYGLSWFGPAYVFGVISYGHLPTDLTRNASGLATSARGSVASDVLGGQTEFGLRRVLGSAALMPFASLEVDHVWQGSFFETATASGSGNGLALRYDSASQTSVPLTLGGRVSSAFALGGDYVLSVSGELGWVHEFNTGRSATAAFVAVPGVPFQVLGVSASRDAALTGSDAKLALNRNVALTGSVNGRFSGVETAVSGFAGLQVSW